MAAVELSVVIASHDAAGVIERCLEALDGERTDRAVEVIVSDSSTDETPALIARFPWVRLLHFDRPLTVPELRGRGIAAATGEVIAILDPFSVVDPGWADAVLNVHRRRPNLVVGGSVDLDARASDRSSSWTIYLNEYGLFMPPVLEGETSILPGSNLSYKRSALWDGSQPRYPIFWKTFVNWEIERSGYPLWLTPDVRVSLNKPIPFRDYLRTRYHHGRCFAGMRVQHASIVARLARASTAMFIPPVLLWRWTRGFWPKRRHRGRLALTIPAQLILFTVWAWGELCGYVRGTGRSCEQLFY